MLRVGSTQGKYWHLCWFKHRMRGFPSLILFFLGFIPQFPLSGGSYSSFSPRWRCRKTFNLPPPRWKRTSAAHILTSNVPIDWVLLSSSYLNASERPCGQGILWWELKPHPQAIRIAKSQQDSDALDSQDNDWPNLYCSLNTLSRIFLI